MSYRSSQRIPFDRSREQRGDSARFFFAVEGAKTEVAYLKALNEILEKSVGTQRLEIIPIPRGKSLSAPNHVYDSLKKYIEGGYSNEEEMTVQKLPFRREYDHAAIMIDRDRWPNLKDIFNKCKEDKIYIGFSKPCFEIWVAFHIGDYVSLKEIFKVENGHKASLEEWLKEHYQKKIGKSYKKEKLSLAEFDQDREKAISISHEIIKEMRLESLEGKDFLEKTHFVAEALLKKENKFGTTIHYLLEFIEKLLGIKIPKQAEESSLQLKLNLGLSFQGGNKNKKLL